MTTEGSGSRQQRPRVARTALAWHEAFHFNLVWACVGVGPAADVPFDESCCGWR